MNRMKNLFTLLTLLLWTLVACSNDSAADEKPGSGGTDIPAGNLPMQNVARAIELIDNAVECYFTGTGMAMSRYYNPIQAIVPASWAVCGCTPVPLRL